MQIEFCLLRCFAMQVLFSDESVFSISANATHVRRRVNERYHPDCVVRTVKHPESVMVWGCFSYYGPGRLSIIPKGTTVNAQRYLQILQNSMLPSARDLFQGQEYIFQDDGAPCHRAKVVKAWLKDRKVKTMEDWPGQSPDINPIENLWNIMKKLVNKCKPTSRIKLIEAVIQSWNHVVSREILENLVESMPRRIDAVICAKGNVTKY